MDDARKLGAILVARRRSLCVAESLTAGHLQALIASVSGSSNYFVGGVTAYNLEQKVALLQVDRAHAAAVDCVSERVAGEMAAGARALFHADIAIATTGYAEPNPVMRVAHPFAWFALDLGDQQVTGRIDVPGKDRVAVQRHVAREVLGVLLRCLREAAPE